MDALWIDENNRGLGEALILDTPAGNNLNTYLKAGVGLFLSSRAYGNLTNEQIDGADKVSESDYMLETFDFVLDPGFPQAKGQIVESKNISTNNKENDMPEVIDRIVTKLTDEVSDLKKDLKSTSEILESSKSENNVLLTENDSLKKNTTVQKKIFENYKKLGRPSEINEVFNKTVSVVNESKSLKRELREYRKLGTVKELSSVIAKSGSLVEKLQDLGPVSKIREALTKSYSAISEYRKLGTPKEINQVFNTSVKYVRKEQAIKESKKIKFLVARLGLNEVKAKKLLKSLSVKEIVEMLEGTAPVTTSQRFRKRTFNESAPKRSSVGDRLGKKDSSTKLMEYFSS